MHVMMQGTFKMKAINILDEIQNLEIIDYTHTGFGIAKYENQVIFVENALINEIVNIKIIKIEKKIPYAKITNLISKSTNRTTPICQHYKLCGGCNLMHMKYEEQLRLKHQVIKTLMHKSKINYENEFEIIPNPTSLNYRNKVTFTSKIINNKIKFGFNKKKSSNIIQINECHLITDKMNLVKKEIENHLNLKEGIPESYYDYINKVTIRENNFGEILLIFHINNKEINKANKLLVDALKRFYEKRLDLINLSIMYKNKILKEFKRKDFMYELREKKFLLSPNSFFQVNTTQTINLYDTIKLHIPKGKINILDAYSGVGTIGIYVTSEESKLYGFEIIKEAVDNACLNLKINNVENAKYICADLEKYFKKTKELKSNFDVVIVDPPRKGISKQLMQYIMENLPKQLIYVSCSAQTLSRDLSILKKYYNITFFEAYDMFSQTTHIETITKLELI